MAYDDDLADRVRALLADEARVDEKRMFGGLAFLLDGHMAVAVSGRGGLMVRVEPDATARLLDRPHVEPMVMRGREMTGWLWVQPDGVRTDDDLKGWVAGSSAFVRTLPPKPGRGAAGSRGPVGR